MTKKLQLHFVSFDKTLLIISLEILLSISTWNNRGHVKTVEITSNLICHFITVKLCIKESKIEVSKLISFKNSLKVESSVHSSKSKLIASLAGKLKDDDPISPTFAHIER